MVLKVTETKSEKVHFPVRSLLLVIQDKQSEEGENIDALLNDSEFEGLLMALIDASTKKGCQAIIKRKI